MESCHRHPESSEEPVYQFTNVADGAVTLTKKVSGSRGDTSKAFTFTFTLTSGLPSTAPAAAYPYTITRQDGTQETVVIRSGETFTLRHNESITISDCPAMPPISSPRATTPAIRYLPPELPAQSCPAAPSPPPLKTTGAAVEAAVTIPIPGTTIRLRPLIRNFPIPVRTGVQWAFSVPAV